MSHKPLIRWDEGGYWTAIDRAEPTVIGQGFTKEVAYSDWREKLLELNDSRRTGCDHTYEISDYGDWDVDMHVCTKCRHFWIEILK